MKRISLALLMWLAALPAHAGVSCSVPFQLQNATIADATQVMANYNAIIACLANAATAGANNDITSLSALSTPLSPSQGGTPIYVGGTSTGSGNTQVVASVTPSTFSLTAGRQVVFPAGFSNTGATTLNVSSSGAINVFRRTQLGISALVGGEIVANHPVTVEYDGTEFVLLSAGPYLVGEIRDYAGSSAPAGYAFIDGSCQLRAGIGADLFSVIGTTYDPTGSTCDVAHFALPDGRGRVLPGQDNMGTNGAANRITNGGSGCTGTTLGGAGCGAQNRTIAQANIPNYNLTVTDPGHVHFFDAGHNSYVLLQSAGGGVGNYAAGSAPETGFSNVLTATTGITVGSAGSGTALATLPPLQVVTKIVKF